MGYLQLDFGLLELDPFESMDTVRGFCIGARAQKAGLSIAAAARAIYS
jgi:hypothetical protein